MPYKDPIKRREYKRLQMRRLRLNPEKRKKDRQWRKQRYKLNKEKEILYNKINYEKNRTKIIARCIINNAIAVGKIIKPKYCSQCNSTEYIQAHHKNYSKPFDIEWLCAKCHMEKDKCQNIFINSKIKQLFPELQL